MYLIRQAIPNEARVISALAIRSKAHWGYSAEFMQACKAELSHLPEELANKSYLYFVAELESTIIGFYKLENLFQDNVLLEALFVEPSAIGSGVGRCLFEHAGRMAVENGGRYIEIQSDPYAESFYKAMGAMVTGKLESGSIPGRYLPVLTLSLTAASAC